MAILFYIEGITKDEYLTDAEKIQEKQNYEKEIVRSKSESDKLMQTEYEKIQKSRTVIDDPEEDINDDIDTNINGNYPKTGTNQITDKDPPIIPIIITPTEIDKFKEFIKENRTYLIIADIILILILIGLLFIPSDKPEEIIETIKNQIQAHAQKDTEYPKNALVKEVRTIEITRNT